MNDKKPIKNEKLAAWLAASSQLDKEELALMSSTSIAYLYVLSSGRRVASYPTAHRLVKAMDNINITREALGLNLLPVLRIEDICTTLQTLEK